MESDSWSRFSRRHQSGLQWRHADLSLAFEEIDGGDEEPRAEFPCPFCSEDFDILGLCLHVDGEHPVEAKNGVCPVCAEKVGVDLVAHMTMLHGNFLKMQRRRRSRRTSSGSPSSLLMLRKELRDGNLQALLAGSSYVAPASNTVPDPLLSSLIYTMPMGDSIRDIESECLEEESLFNKESNVKAVESAEPRLSDKDHQERALRSEFAQGLILSTIFEDDSL